jgi:hypothetical protein
MNSITCSRLVYSSLCELAGLTRHLSRDLSEMNQNLKHSVAAMDTLEENQSLVMDGYNPYNDTKPINGVDTSHNSTEGVEYLLLMRESDFHSLLNQALFTARLLEQAFENMGELDKADHAHKSRRQLVAALHGSLDLSPVEG